MKKMKKADNFDAAKWLVENKITPNSQLYINESNSKFEEITAQLISMVTNGEIDNNDIKQLTYDLTTARRKMFAARKSPEQRAASAAKAQQTKKTDKLKFQAINLTHKVLGIDDMHDELALELGMHFDKEKQAEWTAKFDQIFNDLVAKG